MSDWEGRALLTAQYSFTSYHHRSVWSYIDTLSSYIVTSHLITYTYTLHHTSGWKAITFKCEKLALREF